MKQFNELKPEDISKLVGTVTISFRVKPETKLKLQIAAKKYNISFAKFCENLMENVLNEPEKKETTKPEQKQKKKEERKDFEAFDTRRDLEKYFRAEKLPLTNYVPTNPDYNKEYVIEKNGYKYTTIRTGKVDYKILKEKATFRKS